MLARLNTVTIGILLALAVAIGWVSCSGGNSSSPSSPTQSATSSDPPPVPSPAPTPTPSPQPSPSPSPSPTPTPSPSSAPAPSPNPAPATGCNQALWDHVYNPSRLHVVTGCTTVTGTIDETRLEPDGDVHIRLHLDAQYADMVNAKNVSDQGGDLVLEPVCEHTVTQTDAISACTGYTDTLPIPKFGDHVSVTGSYVLDADHGWMEIHPISVINGIAAPNPLPAPSPGPSPSPTPSPTPSGATCNGQPVPADAACGVPTALCTDGTYSCSTHASGTCSSHGGVACWVCPGTLCH